MRRVKILRIKNEFSHFLFVETIPENRYQKIENNFFFMIVYNYPRYNTIRAAFEFVYLIIWIY